ncbi:MAG: tetratricopeptide repeat protein [Acidimicrobiia bacterium]|nr:tetratricopeptide repeat protein [Acidimicrobiia bacterium]
MTDVARLPSGTITLLFTDIEGSTEKWDHFPDSMGAALAQHDEILANAIVEHRGSIVKQKGDGYFAAFPTALHAVAAATEAQTALAATNWEAGIAPLRVRMALHSGILEPTGGDYYSPEVNKVARLEAVAHGGQVLLSATAAAEVFGALPAGFALDDLGSHRLRSLARSDHIYQLAGPGLSSGFPPLRTKAFERRALPSYQTSFVGRDREISEITDLLTNDDCRLLTVLGPGGTGKTRLAVEAAARLADRWSHGVAFVPLTVVAEPEGVIPAIAEALDFTFDLHTISVVDHKTQLFDYLAGQGLLLVCDNFDHLIPAASLFAELIQTVPEVDIVVTSRQRLGVAGEQILELGGMDLDAHSGSERLPPAWELFEARARQTRPQFRIDEDNRANVARVCHLVHGIPLGIELAAAWVTLLSCAEIADEIDRSLDFLASDATVETDRHGSLRAVFDSSWKLLTEAQQSAFRRLSIFPAPFTRDAAAEITDAPTRTLMELRSRSLLRQTLDGDLELHPLLRQYAQELVPEDEKLELAARHGRFYVQRLLTREQDLMGGPNQLDATAELAEEHENLRAAVEWAMTGLPAAEAVAVLNAAHRFYLNLGWYEGWEEFSRLVELTGPSVDQGGQPGLPYLWAAAYLSVYLAALAQIQEGEAIVDRILPAWEVIGGRGLAFCRYAQGVLAAQRGNNEDAERYLGSALAAGRAEGDRMLVASTLLWYGWVIYELGDAEEAKRHFDESLLLMSNPTNHWGKAFALSKLGVAADAMGDHRRALEYHGEGREMFVKTNDIAGQAYTLSRLSLTHWLLGDYEQARAYGLEGLELFERVNHRWGIGASLCRIGFAEIGLGDTDTAAIRLRAAIEEAEKSGLGGLTLYALTGIGALMAALAQDERASEILAFCLHQPSLPGQYRAFADPCLSELRSRMDGEAFAAAQRRGERWRQDEAIIAATAAVSAPT